MSDYKINKCSLERKKFGGMKKGFYKTSVLPSKTITADIFNFNLLYPEENQLK